MTVKRADMFAWNTKVAWERPGAEHNANRRARKAGAVAVCRVRCPGHWYETPDDAPGRLYRFEDGSEYIVGENGSWIKSARGPGRNATLNYEVIGDGQ